MGKNMWKLDFNTGHEFRARDGYSIEAEVGSVGGNEDGVIGGKTALFGRFQDLLQQILVFVWLPGGLIPAGALH